MEPSLSETVEERLRVMARCVELMQQATPNRNRPVEQVVGRFAGTHESMVQAALDALAPWMGKLAVNIEGHFSGAEGNRTLVCRWTKKSQKKVTNDRTMGA